MTNYNNNFRLRRQAKGKWDSNRPTPSELWEESIRSHKEAVDFMNHASKNPHGSFDLKPFWGYLKTFGSREDNNGSYNGYRRHDLFDEYIRKNNLEGWQLSIPDILVGVLEGKVISALMDVNNKKFEARKVTASDQNGDSLRQRFESYLKPKIKDILRNQNGGLGDQVYINVDVKIDVATNKFIKKAELNWGYGDTTKVILKPTWIKDVANNGIGVVDQCLVSDATFEFEEEDCKIYKATWHSKHIDNSTTTRDGHKFWKSNEGYIGIMGDPSNPMVVKKAKSKNDIVNIVRRWGTRRVFEAVFND
jgi:hypothetical protein